MKHEAIIEAAVKATRLYAGSGLRVHIRDAQKLYSRMCRAVNRVIAATGVSEQSAWDQITAEATRRGPLLAMPGKDI